MAIGNTLKDINVFINGHSYAGRVEEINIPKLKLKTEEFRGGGMLAPVDLTQGLDKITADVTIKDCSSDIMTLISPHEGVSQSIIFRGAYQDWEGHDVKRAVVMRGKVTEIDPGVAKPGDSAKIKLSLTLDYYSDTIGGDVVTEIDVINSVYVTGGIDAYAGIRDALGL